MIFGLSFDLATLVGFFAVCAIGFMLIGYLDKNGVRWAFCGGLLLVLAVMIGCAGAGDSSAVSAPVVGSLVSAYYDEPYTVTFNEGEFFKDSAGVYRVYNDDIDSGDVLHIGENVNIEALLRDKEEINTVVIGGDIWILRNLNGFSIKY